MILQDKRNFLKSSDLANGDTIKFLNEGEWVENKKFSNPDGTPKNQLIFKVEFQGVERDFSLNATNRNALKEAFGKDTALWVGKEASVEKMKMAVAGGVKEVVILTPVM